jgi:hypothetical protein
VLGSDIDAANFGGFLSELVFINDLIGDVTQLDLNEFSMMQKCHEVEVGDVYCHESHTLLCGDDTVEKHFGHQHFCGQGGYFAGVVDSVTPYHESHLVGFCLFWSDRAYELPIRDVFMWSAGTSCWKINSIVLVGFFMQPPMPFANCPNLLAAERLHAFLCFELFISCM